MSHLYVPETIQAKLDYSARLKILQIYTVKLKKNPQNN